MASSVEQNQGASSDKVFDRRAAIKRAAAGAVVTGLVWSSPRVEGLSLRPDYAAAQSTMPFTATFSFTANTVTSGALVGCTGSPPTTVLRGGDIMFIQTFNAPGATFNGFSFVPPQPSAIANLNNAGTNGPDFAAIALTGSGTVAIFYDCA